MRSEYPPEPPLSQYPDAPPPPPTSATKILVQPAGLVHVYDPAVVYELIDSRDPFSIVESNFDICTLPSENINPVSPSILAI
jgi:hypothetical protein